MWCNILHQKGDEMAAPYSVDLRERVLTEHDKGKLKKYEIAELFKVDLKTIYNWLQARTINGWSACGERIYALKPSTRTQRISIIAALNQNTLHSPFLFEGYTNKDLFVMYLETVLISNLKSGEVVIIDNASLHKGDIIKEMIEKAGCTLIYLPAYSPDFNPIEHWWHSVKNAIRKVLEQVGLCLFQAKEMVFDKIGKP
jgi:transposase